MFNILCFSGKHMPKMPGASSGPVPIVRMFGVTEDGNSVLAHIHGFAPYFFVPAQTGFKAESCNAFRVFNNCCIAININYITKSKC